MNPEEEVARIFRECVTLTTLAKTLNVGEANLLWWMGKRFPMVRLKGGGLAVTRETGLTVLEKARDEGLYVDAAAEEPLQPIADNSDQPGTLAYRKKHPTMWIDPPKQKIKAPTSEELGRKQGGGMQFLE